MAENLAESWLSVVWKAELENKELGYLAEISRMLKVRYVFFLLLTPKCYKEKKKRERERERERQSKRDRKRE